ncbi:hypothetical protein KK092_09675 [Curtobacterium flaccumfaciens pv. flaccumfaciens]|uniref:hypothetical protein n=1 Tax=Curtobacterium flaccumfaciens TaxID=2035 RepID=UPI001BDE467D|nr:hypothetical protein [Curtobacterium flaccumfaciens]MBT1669650.1 hypothetical protein [Curtobacterium flaccumfaciens pv. flaccumfaciens]
MSSKRPEERPLERMARAIVAHHLDTLVERSDDGKAPGQPDGLIYLTDGSHAPLEVVSDNDVPHRRLSDALDRQGETIAIARNAPGWYVALHHGSNLKRIRQRVPEILHELPPSEFIDGVVPADTWAAGPDHADRLEELAELGIAYLAAYPDRPGLIRFGTKGWSSWQDPVTVTGWISRVLDREADVAEKLQRHGGPERHALIWATLGSAWAVNDSLNWHPDAPALPKPIGPDVDEEFWEMLPRPEHEHRPPAPLPDPDLPAPITHLWIASSLSRRGALHWSHDGGWERTDWRTPDHEEDIDAAIGPASPIPLQDFTT